MKKYLRVFVGLVALMAAALMLSRAVSAVVLITASPKELVSSPLQLVAYQREEQGTSLRFLQLYNAGDEPLDLNQWTVSLNNTKETILPRTAGHMLPGEHLIFTEPNAIKGVSSAYYLTEHHFNNEVITRITITPPADTLIASELSDLKYTVIDKTKNINNYDQLWARAFSGRNVHASATTWAADQSDTTSLPHDGLYVPPADSSHLQIVEIYPYSKNCAPTDEDILCRDYVKLYNPTINTIDLNEYVLRSDSSSANRTSSNTVSLSGYTIRPGQYITISRTDNSGKLSLTNSGGYVWLEDTWGLALYDETMTRYENAGINEQMKAWAQNDDGVWKWTSKPRPTSANEFDIEVLGASASSLTECPVGKYRNPETNRCRTIEEAVNALSACPEGQVRNPETNRCRSSLIANTLIPCKEGQERNPETNRCRSIASAVAELIPCDEGYERNPATNRCRKSLSDVVGGSNLANVASVPMGSAPENTLKTVLMFTVAVCAVAYGLYEWRNEVWRFVRRLLPHWSG